MQRTPLLTIAEAADLLGVCTKTVRRRISEGHLTGYRLAGSTLIRLDPSEIDKQLRPIPTAGTAA